MTGSRVSDYDYDLPPGRIARYPADRRDESRLLVVPRVGVAGARSGGPSSVAGAGSGEPQVGRGPTPAAPTWAADSLRHLRFRDLVELVRPGDLLVVNESRVLAARLLGRKPTGAPGEVLLLRPWVEANPGGAASRCEAASRPRAEPDDGGLLFPGRDGRPPSEPDEQVTSGRAPDGMRPAAAGEVAAVADSALLWEALVRPGGKLKPGRRLVVSDDLAVDMVDSLPGGGRLVRLDTELPVAEALERHGHVPLPPYVERDDEPLDRERYQTVYARRPGSVAAPTAGLHFTPELLAELDSRGVGRVAVSLHVGVGTFRPVEVDDPDEHDMHAELYSVEEEAARRIRETRRAGGRVWAVGTTVVRTLETVVRRHGELRACSGSTRLFIRPPFDFRAVDCLITNFHLPRSTLLMLVSAFAGYETVMAAYREAVEEGYRFYSYGDAMAVVGEAEGRPLEDGPAS